MSTTALKTKKDFYQEDPQGKDFQGKAKGTNVCQKIQKHSSVVLLLPFFGLTLL